MAVEFFEKVAMIIAFLDTVSMGSAPLKLKPTPPSSSLNSSAVPVSCPSSPPSPSPNDLSLLFEACGRTVNPVNGAVGLLWTGNWHVCQSAVETVLRGGSIRAMPELFSVGSTHAMTENDDSSEAINCNFNVSKLRPEDLNLGLSSSDGERNSGRRMTEKRRAVTPSDASETTTLDSTCSETKMLRLFL
ncbi:hypothetical protein E3N88_06227 [Mikania micrantha]|uniref:LOB domain-containing protein n=1 Tax=Mikania micrantha TaxID=192012 RepID=A0A5N6PNW5_9ASTR|nr:hypothetical protein E3N88_06227 [Mikania micrantha]